MSRLLAAAFTLVTLVPPAAVAANPAEKEVLAAMELWRRAMMKKDAAAFHQVFHADLTYGHSSGLIENKAQATDHVVKSTTVYEDVHFADTKVRITGDTALVTGKVRYLKRPKDQAVVVQDLVTLTVFVKTARGWQMSARQATLTNRNAAPGEAPQAAAGGASPTGAKTPH